MTTVVASTPVAVICAGIGMQIPTRWQTGIAPASAIACVARARRAAAPSKAAPPRYTRTAPPAIPNMAVETAKKEIWYQARAERNRVLSSSRARVTRVVTNKPARNQSRGADPFESLIPPRAWGALPFDPAMGAAMLRERPPRGSSSVTIEVGSVASRLAWRCHGEPGARMPLTKDNRVLVTGGFGFIGSHLVDALRERGHQVVVLDDLSTGSADNLSHCREAIEWVEGDIRDLETCRRAMDGCQLVFHQAALGSVPRSMEHPANTLSVNVQGTANIFTAARDLGVGRVVYASSSSVYGDSEESPKRVGREGRPLSPYALSKRMNEELADVYHRCFGLELVGLRYFNVYGPRQSPNGPYAAAIPRFFKAYLAGEVPTIHGDGEQSRDFTYVADVVRANLAAATADVAGRIFNVAAGQPVTVNRLAELIREVVGAQGEPVHGPPRAGDVRHSAADLAESRTHLGLEAPVDIRDGIRQTTGSYR